MGVSGGGVVRSGCVRRQSGKGWVCQEVISEKWVCQDVG